MISSRTASPLPPAKSLSCQSEKGSDGHASVPFSSDEARMAPSDQLSDGLGRAASSSERPRISDAHRIRSMLAEPTNASTIGDVTCHILSRKKPRSCCRLKKLIIFLATVP